VVKGLTFRVKKVFDLEGESCFINYSGFGKVKENFTFED